MAGQKSASRKLSTKELSEMVNQQSPKEKVQRKIQMIDAIAQPPRHAKNRGISVTTINKMSEPKVICSIFLIPFLFQTVFLENRFNVLPKVSGMHNVF